MRIIFYLQDKVQSQNKEDSFNKQKICWVINKLLYNRDLLSLNKETFHMELINKEESFNKQKICWDINKLLYNKDLLSLNKETIFLVKI